MAIYSLLWLPYGFLYLFHYSVKYELGYLMKIILNLYINFGSMAIFTIILTVKEQVFSSSNIIFDFIDWCFIDSVLMSRKFSCSGLCLHWLGVFLGICILGICYECNIFLLSFSESTFWNIKSPISCCFCNNSSDTIKMHMQQRTSFTSSCWTSWLRQNLTSIFLPCSFSYKISE